MIRIRISNWLVNGGWNHTCLVSRSIQLENFTNNRKRLRKRAIFRHEATSSFTLSAPYERQLAKRLSRLEYVFPDAKSVEKNIPGEVVRELARPHEHLASLVRPVLDLQVRLIQDKSHKTRKNVPRPTDKEIFVGQV